MSCIIGDVQLPVVFIEISVGLLGGPVVLVVGLNP